MNCTESFRWHLALKGQSRRKENNYCSISLFLHGNRLEISNWLESVLPKGASPDLTPHSNYHGKLVLNVDSSECPLMVHAEEIQARFTGSRVMRLQSGNGEAAHFWL